jgi:peptide/nickel transport system substrate-binding protein
MKVASAARRLAPIFLVAAFAIAPLMSPAMAQKQGGSITVGLEFDIPGFDP